MDSLLKPILNSIQDLVKYNIVQYVNTGDKTMDNLINTFLLSVIVVIFSGKIWTFFYEYTAGIQELFMSRFGKYNTKITEKNIDFFSKRLENCKTGKKITWYVNMGKINVSTNIVNYICNYLPFLISEPKVFDFDKCVLTDSVCNRNPLSILRNISAEKTVALYAMSFNDIIGIETRLDPNSGNNTLMIKYTSENVFSSFLKILTAPQKETNGIESDKPLTVYDKDGNPKYIIYPDRTFDMIVSRHKTQILNLINDFEQSNNALSKFNNYGTYNLGFILYGRPGTGKTTLIKAICNRLRRDAKIVDLSKVKTKNDFANLFSPGQIQRYVYVFEEFDSVQDIIKSRDCIKKEDRYISRKEQLTKQKYQLILSNKKAEVSDLFKKELDKIEQEIKDEDDKLNLETLLTVLDGVNEMRGRVIIASTNYIEHIDTALVRPGRFDAKIRLDHFNSDEIAELLQKMYKGSVSDKEYDLIGKMKYRENEFTPTDIINICQRYQRLSAVIDMLRIPSEAI